MKVIKIVSAHTHPFLMEQMEKAIRKGYKPQGGPFAKDGKINQLMIKDSE